MDGEVLPAYIGHPHPHPGNNGVLYDYKDYLGFCEGLHYDLKNEFVLFPRHLQQARGYEKASAVPEDLTGNDALNDAERCVIFETLDAFRQM